MSENPWTPENIKDYVNFWQDAVCADTSSGVDPEWWYEGDPFLAKTFCERCPIRLKCLDYAIEHRETDGVWGGLDANERRLIKRTQRTGKWQESK